MTEHAQTFIRWQKIPEYSTDRGGGRCACGQYRMDHSYPWSLTHRVTLKSKNLRMYLFFCEECFLGTHYAEEEESLTDYD